MSATGRAKGSGEGRIVSIEDADLVEVEPRFHALTDLGRMQVMRRALADGIVDPLHATEGKNTWVNGLIEAIWLTAKFGTPFQVTHLQVGTSGVTPLRTNVALNAPLTPRKPVTEIIIDGDYLRTSTFIGGNDFNGTTLREGGLWTALTGGTLLNHLLWAVPFPKTTGASALAEVNLQLTPT